MSYSRDFSQIISVPYSGTVKYPASQNGGYISYSGTAHEEVVVSVNVDTEMFDTNVNNCNYAVSGLTTSVETMNAAQCVSIFESSKKISDSIINGFFKTINTDIQTYIVELQQRIQAKLALLRKQKDLLLEKQENMKEDYHRTSKRYQKIFEDLNKELENRIHQLDQPVFSLVANINQQTGRMTDSDVLHTATTFNKESNLCRSQISAANVKQISLNSINKAKRFILQKKKAENTVEKTSLNDLGNDDICTPAIVVEYNTGEGNRESFCMLPKSMEMIQGDVEKKLSNMNRKIENTVDDNKKVKERLEELYDTFEVNNEHDNRVLNNIKQLISLNI